MARPDSPESSLLRRFLLLQSALHAAPDVDRLAETVVRELEDLPGVAGCTLCIEGKVYGSTDLHGEAGRRRFAVATNQKEYGALYLAVADESSFEMYSPFVTRMTRCVAFHVENSLNARALAETNRTLEAQVREHTEALRESEQRMKLVLKGGDLGAWDWHVRTGHMVFNEHWAEMLGCAPEEIRPHMRSWKERIHPDDLAHVMEALTAHLKGEADFFEAEQRLRHKAGHWVWVLAKGCVIERDAAGKPVRACGTHQDITRRKLAEEELSHSHDLMRYVIEHMRGAVAVHDRDLRYVYVSQRYLEEYRVREQDIIGRHHYEVFPDLPLKWREVHRRALAGECLSADNDPYVREDGTMDWTQWECRPWYRSDGSIGGIIVYTEVINERKRAEEALADEATRRRILIEQSRDGIVVLDEQGKVYEANRRFADMLGYSMEEVLRLHVWDWDHRFTPDQLMEMMRTIDETGAFFETSHRRRDGTLIDMEISINAAMCGGRKLIFCVCRDISGRRQAEIALRESEARLRAIFDSAPEFIYLKDTGLRYTHCNKAMERLFGRSRDEIIGRTAADLYGEEHGKEIDEVDRKVLSGRPMRGSFTRTIQDAPRIIETSKSPVFDAAGKVVGICGVSRDITEEVRIREQMRQAQKVEAIGRLAGGVAHDLNNMLTPILGYGEMLMEGMGIEDARRDPVKEILRAGFRARDLVRQLLAFSRKQTLQFRRVDINEAIRDFEKLLRRTVPEDIDIAIVRAPDLRFVLADVGQIQQILMNLAVNSADAMPRGGRLIIETSMAELDAAHAAGRPDVKPGPYVLLTVRDTGCGMDRETLEQVFDPFFTTKGERGTGLGLATVYGIVKQHGGNIWVYSEPGMGAVFNIYLPAAGEAHAGEKFPRAEESELKGTETILLVEDNEQVRHLAQAILERQGYNVLPAKDGEDALAALASHRGPVHLLLTDVVMPGMNGRELYGKTLQDRPDLKVLYMSGYTDDVIAHRGVLEEGVQFIQKPFSVRDLAVKVRDVLGQG